jgi:hypothetical protein
MRFQQSLMVSCGILFWSLAPAQDDMTSRLMRLRQDFDAKVQANAEQTFVKSLNSLNGQYIQGLERQQKASEQLGRLEESLALKAERDAVIADKLAATKPLPASAGESLKRIRKTYTESYETIVQRRDDTVASLKVAHVRDLDALVVALTKEGKLAEATAVKATSDALRPPPPKAMKPKPKGPSVATLPAKDQEIARALEFSNPDPSPVNTRGMTFIKGRITVVNKSSTSSVLGKMTIEMRMLFGGKDQGWKVIRCSGQLDVPQPGPDTKGAAEGEQIVGVSFSQSNSMFITVAGDRKAVPLATYTIVRWGAVTLFESDIVPSDDFPKEWWKDEKLVVQK